MLSGHLPDLDALEVLLVVARTGSLNTAAGQIGVSQQAVSARIASLETQTGLVLVTRTARGSTLTRAGTMVADWAAKLLEVAAEVDAGLASLRADQRVRLRVSASLTIAELLLPAWLVAIRADTARRGLPAVDVMLRAANSETVVAQVLDGQADVGFVEGPAAPRGLRSRGVGSDRLLVVVRPDHRWARQQQRPLSAAELAATPLVTREEGSGTRQALQAALRTVLGAHAVFAPPALAMSTSSAVRAAVIAGAGPAVLSELAVADDVSIGRLRVVPTADLALERTLRAVWVGGSTPPAGPVRDLIALAASHGRIRSGRNAPTGHR